MNHHWLILVAIGDLWKLRDIPSVPFLLLYRASEKFRFISLTLHIIFGLVPPYSGGSQIKSKMFLLSSRHYSMPPLCTKAVNSKIMPQRNVFPHCILCLSNGSARSESSITFDQRSPESVKYHQDTHLCNHFFKVQVLLFFHQRSSWTEIPYHHVIAYFGEITKNLGFLYAIYYESISQFCSWF